MKNTIIKYAGLALFAGIISCKKDYLPSTQIDEKTALTDAASIKTATIGTYALLRNDNYINNLHWLQELPSDEVAQGQNSSDDVTNVYKYTHLRTSARATGFWQQAYYAAVAAAKIIDAVSDNSSEDLLQVKGENLFIRAMVHFNLVNIFGRPYAQGNGQNPGIPIIIDGLTDEQKLSLKRSTVAEVYDFVIKDLLQAATLMTESKDNSFASKEAAYALLARVYLYKGDNANAMKYADTVINSGRYTLLQDAAFETYFRGVPTANTETIFCVRHLPTENKDYSSIGSLYYSGDANGNALGQAESGWGEIYASKKYYDFLSLNAADKRMSFISPYRVNGNLQTNSKLNPPAPMYYVNKYNLQEGIVNLSSPVYLRLAEMYLIRAEANAKLGNVAAALTDLNIIRTRAGIPNYTAANVNATKTILDLVLEERYLELSFEGHRAYDLFRNNRQMVRNYPGTHAVNGNLNMTINPTDARVIQFIPQTEIDKNRNLTQNP